MPWIREKNILSYWHKIIFKRNSSGLNSEFSIWQNASDTKAKKHSLTYYLPVVGEKIIWFIHLLRVFILSEM